MLIGPGVHSPDRVTVLVWICVGVAVWSIGTNCSIEPQSGSSQLAVALAPAGCDPT